MKKQFAFLLMGAHYTPETHQVTFETEEQITYIYTVPNLPAAEELAARLEAQGVGAIELCGAFGKEGAARIAEITHHRVAVGYVVHEPEQDPLFLRFFGR